MNMPIIESNRTDNDLLAKFNDDFDLDDELKELTELDLDTDTEDEIIKGKIDDDDATDDKIEEIIAEEQEDENERITYLDKINELIGQANLLTKIRNDFSKNVNEICELMNELHDEIYSDDSWLRLVELNKVNMLLDEALDYVWKTFYGENIEKHERINIDKDKDIDGHVSKYTNIANDKLELVSKIGEILDSTMIELQNEVGAIDDVKQASEIDIDTLKLMHNTLVKILKKWRDIILEAINRDMHVVNPKILRRKVVNQKILKRKKVNQKILRRKIIDRILRTKIVNQIHQKTILKIGLVIGLNMRYKILQNTRRC